MTLHPSSVAGPSVILLVMGAVGRLRELLNRGLQCHLLKDRLANAGSIGEGA